MATASASATATVVDGFHEVERLLEQRTIDGVEHFRVRWKGFSREHDTWEPAENLGEETTRQLGRRLRSRVRAALSVIRREDNLIDAYCTSSWSKQHGGADGGASMLPTKELARAREQIQRSKRKICDTLRQLDEMESPADVRRTPLFRRAQLERARARYPRRVLLERRRPLLVFRCSNDSDEVTEPQRLHCVPADIRRGARITRPPIALLCRCLSRGAAVVTRVDQTPRHAHAIRLL